ncbi:MAG TPA: hypothetical protein VNO30_03695 [Kofleriaceae bacterium]|nr:hypothetical protein [Kofleriaceae bacterium]
MARCLLRPTFVRGIAFALVLAGCVRIAPDAGPPPSYPTLESDRRVEPNPMDLADLRSIAGAASISLEVGPGPIVSTQSCADTPGASSRPCYRCTLAVFEPLPGPAAGQTAHPLEGALRTLATTLLAYPHSFLRAARVERIALCRKLVADTDESTSASADTAHHIAGLAEGSAWRLMVNLDHRDLEHPDATLHHEIFHLFDRATAPGGNPQRDAAWERLNPRGFRYGDPASATIYTGFVNDYAKTDIAEDKASVFEFVMSFPAELCARAVDDPFLLAKARLVLSRIEVAVPPGLGEFARRKASCLAPP